MSTSAARKVGSDLTAREGLPRVWESNGWVSSVSRWNDDKWQFDRSSSAISHAALVLNWDADLLWGGRLTQPKNAPLLYQFRYLAWSLMFDAVDGPGLSTRSANILGARLRYLASWMIHNDYADFGELTQDSLDKYVDDLGRMVADDLDDVDEEQEGDEAPKGVAGPISVDDSDSSDDDNPDARRRGKGYVVHHLLPWQYIWRQRSSLAEGGVRFLSFEPFRRGGLAVAIRKVSARAHGWIRPLPDEVASPIMEAALRMLGTPAVEVIALQTAYYALRTQLAEDHTSAVNAVNMRQDFLSGVKFSTLPGEKEPWHPPFSTFKPGAQQSRQGSLKAAIELRQVVDRIRDAAVIVLQAAAGQRIGELCSLRATGDCTSGLPSSVEVRKSRSGLLELFFLKGVLQKTVAAPVEVEWLIGSRSIGSDYLPPPIKALEVLERLFEPWRKLGGTDLEQGNLILSSRSNTGLPWKHGTVRCAYNGALLKGQRNFVTKCVDLSQLPDRSQRDEDLTAYRATNGAEIKTHQWRKSFALYVFRTDNTLIPALAQQFKHISLAMTEEHYIGNDPTLVTSLDSTILQSTVNFFLRASGSRELPLAGRFAEIIDRYRHEIDQLIDQRTGAVARTVVEDWVIENDFRIWFGAHGKCFVGLTAEQGRCHEIAGTGSWYSKAPNYATREASVCAGCKCYAVDGEHVDYWRQRYITNQSAWLEAVEYGDTRGFRAIKGRADQAAGFLRALKVNVPEVSVINVN